MKKLLFLSFCLTFCLHAAVLTENGKPSAEIILGDKPTRSAQFAAKELQYHVRLMTGAVLPIVRKEGTLPTKIFIGTPGEFQSQEYLVQVKDHRIVLSGKDAQDFGAVDYARYQTYPGYWTEKGSLDAVYDFLERLGVRWYLPSAIGTAYEKKTDLKVDDFQIRRKPSFFFRDMMALPIPGDLCGDTVGDRREAVRKQLPEKERVLWFLRQRHGGKRMEFGHTLYTFYRRFYPAHKDWFAKGQQAARDMQLCYTNPEVIAQVVQDARDFFDGKIKDARTILNNYPANYRSDCFPLGAMDNRRWCKCDRCQALLRFDGHDPFDHFSNCNASEYWFTFVAAVANEIKKTHPDKWVGTLCYSGYTLPPKQVKLPDNVIVRPAVNVTRIYSRKNMEEVARLLQQWKTSTSAPNAVKFVSIWYCYPNVLANHEKNRLFPHFIGRHVKDYFRHFKELGAAGMFWEPSYVVGGAGPMFDMVDGYINWKLAWDNDLDADKLYDELFDKFYGPAAKDMKAFYETAEKIYCDPANYPNEEIDQNEGLSWRFLGTDARMAELQSCLDKAEKAATAEPYKSRVELFRKTLWAYMCSGKKAAAANRQEAFADDPGNLIPDGFFEKAPVGQRSMAGGKIVSGGIAGNALELRCSIAQQKLFRTQNLQLKLASLAPGKYRMTGFLKGEFHTLWAGIDFQTGKGKDKRVLNIRKARMLTDDDHWRSFRWDFEIPEGVSGGNLLFQIYGERNAVILLDNLKLVKRTP